MTIVVEIQPRCGWGVDWWTHIKGIRLGRIAIHWARVDAYELSEVIVRARKRRVTPESGMQRQFGGATHDR